MRIRRIMYVKQHRIWHTAIICQKLTGVVKKKMLILNKEMTRNLGRPFRESGRVVLMQAKIPLFIGVVSTWSQKTWVLGLMPPVINCGTSK